MIFFAPLVRLVAFSTFLLAPLAAAAIVPYAPEAILVRKAFDNTQFTCRIEPASTKDAFRVYRLHYPSPVHSEVEQNNTIPAELYMPADIRPHDVPRPAVICLHILDGNVELVQITCSALATRGIPALWFHLPYYGERSAPVVERAVAADPKLFASAVSQAIQDVRRSVDVLAARPEIDPQRIGVMGISLGGILAASAAEKEPRIHRAALLLAGGDLLPVIYQANETRELGSMIRRLPVARRAEVEGMIQEADPLRHADRLRARAQTGRVLMVNAADDEVIPRACTKKLAAALGMAERVVWLQGLGHYTAIAALPQTLQKTVDFFAQDLPPGVKPADPTAKAPSPEQRIAGLLRQCGDLLTGEPEQGCCHAADLELSATAKDGKKIAGRLRLVRGPRPKFAVRCEIPSLGDVALGSADFPWMASGKRVVFQGRAENRSPGEPEHPPLPPGEGWGEGALRSSPVNPGRVRSPIPLTPTLSRRERGTDPLAYVEPKQLVKLQMLSGILNTLAMTPNILDRWVTIRDEAAAGKAPVTRITRKDRAADYIEIVWRADQATPAMATFEIEGFRGTVVFHAWEFNAAAREAMFQPPADVPVKEVAATDLVRMFSAAFSFAAEWWDKPRQASTDSTMYTIAKDPAGHGILCRSQGKTILMIAGTPAEMGRAQGTLLRDPVRKLCERILYLVGAGDSLHTGTWAFDRFAEIERRTQPHLPKRYLEECDAMAQAAGVSIRDGRAANLFPERFHCSGVAVCGKATADGKVLHARVLDYMRDIRLQDAAVVAVFMPDGRNKWVSQGYAGFLGTVTAMNEKGLAVGEMGGRGEGDWDGMPMSFLLREIMERAATVQEALEILRRAPRTCEYYYVLSDKSRAMAAVHCDARQMTVLRPGEQHPRLPPVPADSVLDLRR